MELIRNRILASLSFKAVTSCLSESKHSNWAPHTRIKVAKKTDVICKISSNYAEGVHKKIYLRQFSLFVASFQYHPPTHANASAKRILSKNKIYVLASIWSVHIDKFFYCPACHHISHERYKSSFSCLLANVKDQFFNENGSWFGRKKKTNSTERYIWLLSHYYIKLRNILLWTEIFLLF